MLPLARVRATLRDGLYRHERRQAKGGDRARTVLIGVLFVVSPALAVPALLVLAPIWAGETVFQERDRNTLEGLLLTPVDRERILWAKLMAAVRPLLVVVPLASGAGAVAGLIFGWESGPAGWAVLGCAFGLILGLDLLGACVARGSYGLAVAVRTGSRLRVTGRAIWSPLFLVLFEVLILVVLGAVFWAVGYAMVEAEEDLPLRLAGVGTTLAALAMVVAKVLVINLHIACVSLERLAPGMDELLLEGRDREGWPG